MEPSESSKRMAAMIKKAMADEKITNDEYNKIMAIADEDGVLDSEEASLLKELQGMLQSGMVKRTAE